MAAIVDADPARTLGSKVRAAESVRASGSSAASPEPKIYCLSRHVSPIGSPYWKVGLVRRGRAYVKSFSEKRFGTMEAAKEAALAWRDQIIAQHAMVSRREMHVLHRTSTHSGIPGVILIQSGNTSKWRAQIHYADGSKKSKSFSVAKYGAEMAFQLAVEMRRKMLEAVVDQKTVRPTHEVVLALAPEYRVTEVVLPSSTEYPKPQRTVSSEVPGVLRFMQKSKGPDRQARSKPVWMAEYCFADKTHRRKTFSVDRYGEEEAKQMAIDQQAAWQHEAPSPRVKGAGRSAVSGRKPVSDIKRKVVTRQNVHGSTEKVFWMVVYRFSDGDDSRRQHASFSVARYGEERAKQMAQQQRQAWMLNPPDKQPQGRSSFQPLNAPSANNPAPGVYRNIRKDPSGREAARWTADIQTQEGKTQRRSFAVKVYGEEQARQMALEQRERWLLAMS